MTKELWINLPVKDLAKSKKFFTKMDFTFNENAGNTAISACMQVGIKNIVVMLFEENSFKGFTKNEIVNTQHASEVLFSIDAESRQEVDEMANKALEAGGSIFGEPSEVQGWMYGCGFADLDGHRWNVLHMDFSKIPK